MPLHKTRCRKARVKAGKLLPFSLKEEFAIHGVSRFLPEVFYMPCIPTLTHHKADLRVKTIILENLLVERFFTSYDHQLPGLHGIGRHLEE
jgi:hypothetical protein